jgi:hypothetical protein
MKRGVIRPKWILGRRAFLRGVGGVAIGLPVLDAMLDHNGESWAGGPAVPRRYLATFVGTSLGGDGDDSPTEYVPDRVGADYDLKTALAPLADVQDEISVVSNLWIPEARGGSIPDGGRSDDFHTNAIGPQWTGVKSTDHQPEGPSSDQIVADRISTGTAIHSLKYKVQASWYLTGSEAVYRDLMSWRYDSNDNLISLPATASPKAAWDALFFNFTPPEPEDQAELDYRLRARQSILDIVRGNTERLIPKLGRSDQVRMQRHLDELRDLERRIQALPPVQEGNCQQVTDPGADDPVGNPQGRSGDENTYDTNLGYSNEDERAYIFNDLVHMAFVCDISRVGTLLYTMAQSHLNMFPFTGQRTDLHEIGHGGTGLPDVTHQVSIAIAWHMEFFAYLVAKMRDTDEGPGSLLDNCVISLMHEGGHGRDTSDQSGNTVDSSHSTENMAMLVAGRAGGLSPGRHIRTDQAHPAQVLVSCMRAAGLEDVDQLGEVRGHVQELFV